MNARLLKTSVCVSLLTASGFAAGSSVGESALPLFSLQGLF